MTKARDIYDVAEIMAAALEPFAESPEQVKDYQCHRGIVRASLCIRCSKGVAAWYALEEYKNVWLEKGAD